MTIQEAIKSGKPFRRPKWSKGVYIKENGTGEFIYHDLVDDGSEDRFTPEDILATDWEIKQ